MKWGSVRWVLGAAWLGLSGVFAIPLALALLWGEPWQPFGYALASALSAGLLARLGSLDAQPSFGHRDAFLTVTLVWVSVCALGTIPFATHPALGMPIVDALFESVSGFTTTGATVLSGLDQLPWSLLLWRSLTQWLGGMGMVIFGVAILPLLGVGGMGLYKAEAPGPPKDKMTPRIAETAKLLWVLYLGATVVSGLLFYGGGMSAFDAVNHAMTAISTAGFSTHDQSFGYWDSSLIHVVTTATMLAGGTSFAILHRALTGGFAWSEHPELRAYVGVFCLATLLLTLDLSMHMGEAFPGVLVALEHAAFQAASILTTTGYSTRDFDLWPGMSHVVLLSLFLVGGMAGSTAGGPKVIRVLLLTRLATMQFFKLLHRRGVDVVRLGAHTVDDEILASTLGFVAMWGILLAIGTLALAASGTDVMTSFSAAAASLGNVGPAFGGAGPSQTFAHFDTWSKLVMELLMILGRLEIYTVLIVLTPGFWRF